MNLAFLLAALSGPLSPEKAVLTLQGAEIQLSCDLKKHISDPVVLKETTMALLDLQASGNLDREHVDLLVGSVIRKHYLDPSCTSLPLSERIHTVGISDSDAQRIFYLKHDDYQDDGWSCGLRALFNAAAVHKVIRSRAPVFSSHAIGQISSDFRRTNPGIAGAIEYIIFRSKLNEVSALLSKDQDVVVEALRLLRQDNPDILNVFLQLQPDYFLRRVALGFLELDQPKVIDALAALGKSSHNELKKVKTDLLKLITDKINELEDSGKLDQILQDLYDEIPKNGLANDAALTTFISWGADIQRNRDEIVGFILTNMHPGMPAMGRQIHALGRTIHSLKVFFEKARNELVALCIDSKEIKKCSDSLRQAINPTITSIQDQICTIDDRMKAIYQAIDNCTCPKLKVALALFHSGADFDNDDIVDLLKRSNKKDVNDALMHINEAEHGTFQECIATATDFIDLLDPRPNDNWEDAKKVREQAKLSETRDKLREKLAKVLTIKEIESVTDAESLNNSLSAASNTQHVHPVSELDKALRKIRGLLHQVDSQRIVVAFSMLQPEYRQTGILEDATIKKLAGLLEVLKDPLVQVVVDKLEKAQTQEAALSVEVDLARIAHTDTIDDALGLLRSDHTKVSWGKEEGLSDVVKNKIACIKKGSPEIGKFADPEHLLKLAGMRDLELPPENVHIVGDFVAAEGPLFDMSDSIPIGIPASERALIESSETKIDQSDRVAEAIKDHFKTNYLDRDETGVHHFICNLIRPSQHWILVSLVKIKGKKPVLVVLDSKNYPIKPDSTSSRIGTDTVIAFLYNKFIRPFS